MAQNHVNQPLLANYQQPPPPPQQYPPQQINPNNFSLPQGQAQYSYQGQAQIAGAGAYAQQHITFAIPSSPCPYCNHQTANFQKRVPGGVTWIWCLGLFMLTGVFCCVPFCVQDCKDTQIVCVNCHQVKSTWESNCC